MQGMGRDTAQHNPIHQPDNTTYQVLLVDALCGEAAARAVRVLELVRQTAQRKAARRTAVNLAQPLQQT
jgi:hypothetical protein